VLEIEKKDGDAGMRKSKKTYKVLQVKGRNMSFTCQKLKDLCNQYTTLNYDYYQQ